MESLDSLTLMDIAKLVGITFMALMAFVSLLFTVLSILIYRNNKTEVEAAKEEVKKATSELEKKRVDLDKHIKQGIKSLEKEFHETQKSQKEQFSRDLTMQMNLSLLDFETQITNPSNDRVYALLSRLMNTGTIDCLPAVEIILEHDGIDKDVKAHCESLIKEIKLRT